ncbi:MAG: phosphatase PAP2 family protein [Chlamydiia bacterium]|nr:phosphatase PAP2 family protein [Chlamydiia bacterium]
MDQPNHLSLFRKAYFLIFLAILSYFFLDRPLQTSPSPFFKPLYKVLTLAIFPPLHLALWGSFFLIARIKKNVWTLPLFEIAFAQGLGAIFVRIAKFLIGRARPELYLKKGIFGLYGLQWDNHFHSFPSGHALTAFTLATSLSFLLPKWRTPFLLLALAFSLSRVLLAKHYLSDVLGGAACGIIISTLTHTLLKHPKVTPLCDRFLLPQP